eukprot:TRINITY_DN538_c0_g1_i3.p1 TRINITY_DN538_c0_g1~~TRINITY_DN538_c0_g1_i3.p1  ORF type:complete len:197 (-),score=32.03 TRINITY_DN538_c0_g1_i3:519-1109(-)
MSQNSPRDNSHEDNSHEDNQSEIPQPDPHQVGGHLYSEGKKGNLATKEYIFKHSGNDPRGFSEVNFYNRVYSEAVFEPLHPYICKFAGMRRIASPHGIANYLALENLTSTFSKPNQMDIKMGVRTWDDSAPQSLIDRRLIKEGSSTTPKLGFRMTGLHCYEETQGKMIKYDRRWGMDLTVEQMNHVCTPKQPCIHL